MDAKPPASAQLSGFAPAVAGGGGGGGAGTGGAESSAKAPPQETKQTAKKRGPKKSAKKGGGVSSSAATSGESNGNDLDEQTTLKPLSDVGPSFEPLSLPQIQLRIKNLLQSLPTDHPTVPDTYDPNDTTNNVELYAPVKSFASTLQVVIEEYNLLLSLVSSATYRWGVDRSGASQQNLGVMSAELQTCQDVISTVVSARLSNVLCPAVDVLIGEIEIVRGAEGEGGEEKSSAKKRKLNADRLSTSNSERRINHYKRPLVDPSYVHLCHVILARNAALIRHTVATSIHTAQRVIGDYLKAMKKDSSHEAGKGGYY